MEWMVIGRLWLNKQIASAYCLAFKKVFGKCSTSNSSYKLGETLIGIVTDWSDAQINGLKKAIGKDAAKRLLKGCSVHWLRSCKRVAERISNSSDKPSEVWSKCPATTNAVERKKKIANLTIQTV